MKRATVTQRLIDADAAMLRNLIEAAEAVRIAVTALPALTEI